MPFCRTLAKGRRENEVEDEQKIHVIPKMHFDCCDCWLAIKIVVLDDQVLKVASQLLIRVSNLEY
jgi:hypothetical protein